MNRKPFNRVLVLGAAVLLAVPVFGLVRDQTKLIGRGTVSWMEGDQVRLKDAYLLVNDTCLCDFTFSFEGRAPEGAGEEEVGIWATFRQLDRNHRYVVGVRGAPHSDIYLARYAPDGNDRMLALQPVPTLKPGEWAKVRIEGEGSKLRIYLNGRKMVSVEDASAPFTAGRVGVGGGYHAAEFRNILWLGGVAEQQDEGTAFAAGAVKINFQPLETGAPAGWQVDAGNPYSKERGFGWLGPVGTRDRKQTGDTLKDTLATIAHEQTDGVFKLDLEPGEYLLTLHSGDQHKSVVNLECPGLRKPIREKTEAGVFVRSCAQVEVGTDGLVLKFHRKAAGAGTSLNWLVVEPKDQVPADRWIKGAPGLAMLPEKAALRKKQRAAYQPVTVPTIGSGRSEVSLDGDWLFLPDYEFKKTPHPEGIEADDSQWHVMHVPDLWSPYAAWLFGETFPDMPCDKGASDSYYEYRHARVEAFTFDWEKTRSAWYRKHLVLPEIPAGKRFELHFDAIAKVAHIYVNGAFVGKNYGMFGDIQFDVTPYLKPGSNVIAVKVDQERNDIENGDEILDVAISVEVTRKMLSALPFGMTRQDPRGIWQPTRLVITDQARISDIFVRPRLDGADVDVTLKNLGDNPARLLPELAVIGQSDGKPLTRVSAEPVAVPAGKSKVVTLSFHGLEPRLWSPADPRLYRFDVALKSDTGAVDTMSVVSGFKTFETKGNRFYLNGKPYALRGANHCPNILAPNDGALAERFMQIMNENNLNATRFHAVPGTEPWMAAADRNGVLISYEGTWPWLMLRGPIPPRESLDIWMDEFQRLIKKYRNHPSLALWTVNNEMKFHVFHAHKKNRTPADDADVLARWKVVSEAVKMIRATDPTHPVAVDSCYIRSEHWHLKKTPAALGIDDGDIDDRHAYFNWYNESVFNLFDRPDHAGSPDRPYIGQEMSTGYYNGDSGHPVRAYLFAHQTPQSWVGQWAYEQRDPAIFMTRHAMLTKELAEYYRRERRDDWAGTLIFGLATWFKNQWLAAEITPYPAVTDGLRHAMAPVLVSARMTGRNVFSGETFSVPVSIVNDAEDGKALGGGTLKWWFAAGGKILSKGQAATPPVGYYTNRKLQVQLKAPGKVPDGRADAQLCFELVVGGKVVSRNHYAMRIGEKAWAVNPAKSSKGKVVVLNASDETKKLFQSLGLDAERVSDLGRIKLGANDRLVLDGKLGGGDMTALKRVLAAGKGRVVWIHPEDQAAQYFPKAVSGYRKQNGEVVTMLEEEARVFDGLEIGDMAWMGGPTVDGVPVSSTGGYLVHWKTPGLRVLAEEMQAHGYLKTPKDKLKYWVTPLVEIQEAGMAPVILTEMAIDVGSKDPIGMRLWANLLGGEE